MINILVIRNKQNKVTLAFHLTPVRMAVINRVNDNKCSHGCEVGEHGFMYIITVEISTGASEIIARNISNL